MTFRSLLPTRRELLLAGCGALLMFVAYPPASLVLPSFVCLIPFLWALDEARKTGRVRVTGYWFGVIVNGAILYWMVVALWHFTPLSALGYAASLLLALGPLWAGLAWVTHRAVTRARLPLWIVFPVLWTGLEWLLAHLSDLAFPWLGLGTSLARVPVLVQWADLAGARGVTLWLAWANVALFISLQRRLWKPAAAFVATLALASAHGTWRERSLPMRPATTVAVLQPNVGFDEKRNDRDNIRLLVQLLNMSRVAARDSSVRLIAWPEAAVPDYFVRHPDWRDSISLLARELGRPLLVGGLDVEFLSERKYNNYNAAFFVDASGAFAPERYQKRYLVPIVERVPFLNPDWFGDMPWFGGFERGITLPLFRADGAAFGVVICYESAFEDLARKYRRKGADLLVNITNDAWFGLTAAPYQHASHLVMRAIETRMGVARAANSGISQFVTPLGYPLESTSLSVEAIASSVVLTSDVRTLYVRLGDWVGWLALAGTVLIIVTVIIARPPQEIT